MKRTSFHPDEIEAFKPSEKIGLIAAVNPDGEIHMTLITSIMASAPNQLTLGQFCTGRGKWFIQENHNLSFLVMTLDKKFWRGKARWTHKRLEGKEYEIYNEMPMFRYNTYFGVNTVHYLDLVETSEPRSLPMFDVIRGVLLTKLIKSGAKTGSGNRILKPFAEALFNDLGSLKFLSYLGVDGFPVVIPLVQCQAADSSRLIFSTTAFRDELLAIPEHSSVAIYCLNMKMQSVLIRGRFNGYGRLRFAQAGSVDISWVYNSMPPIHEQIYPQVDLKPVESF